MLKVNSINDLPKWFKLKNYNCISDLSIEEIKDQISLRISLYEGYWVRESHIDRDLSSAEVYDDYSDNENWRLITSGNALLKLHRDFESERLSREENIANGFQDPPDEINCGISSSKSFMPYSSSGAYMHVKGLLNEGLIIEDEEYVRMKNELLVSSVSKVSQVFDVGCGSGYGSVVTSIELVESTDKEILHELKSLLPKWRKQLGFEEPDVVYSKQSDYKKVAPYKIIPLLDLWIWERLVKIKIPLRVIVSAIYPIGEKGETELKQTVIPLAKKLLSENYRDLR